MDGNIKNGSLVQPPAGDPEIDAVHERIESSRKDLSETIEALVYKADVPARTADAIGEGIEVAKTTLTDGLATAKDAVVDGLDIAKDVAVLAGGIAADDLKGLAEQAKIVASHATVQASELTADVVDVAAAATSTVPVSTRRKIAYGLGAVVLLAIVVRLLRRKRNAEVDIAIEDIFVIEEAPQLAI